MPDSSRHISFLNELNSVETQISIIVNKLHDAESRISELEELLSKLRSENNNLQMQLSSLEQNSTQFIQEGEPLFTEESFKDEEKSELKIKVTELIKKIDNHLSS